ncbi:palmitoyltransferase ZDHHC1-like isoform X1 [Mobula hypostoma]|uniref:palmitoyltransferase ZDHHC1-like isoform X1 n=2 Tax=Mobula hypostoma TaxID=723540 RepID=UPI002FC35130
MWRKNCIGTDGSKNQMEGSETGPEENHRTGRRCTPRRPKLNGWSWPPHPYQILTWSAYLYFLIVVVGVLIPLLPRHWIPAGYIYFGAAFTWHLGFYVIAATVDPADDNVRLKRRKKLPPVFRCRTHKPVLQNRYCLLCEVDVGYRSKHCKQCNKCVCNFDHHCKWLNNCVGSRNYRYFLNSVIIALLGSVVIVIISGFVLVAFFINPNLLRSNPKFESVNDANTWLAFLPYFSVRINAPTLLVLAVVTIGLSLIALILLCYLLFFHFYLMWNRLSTYEYKLFHSQRQRLENDEVEAPQLRPIQVATKGGGIERLTDISRYTGSHKLRFDESGAGEGISGREYIAENTGYVANYQGAGTYDWKVKK